AVTEITPESLAAYRRWLYHYRNERTGKPLKFCTQASYLSAVAHWLGWLAEQGWIDADPSTDLERPKGCRKGTGVDSRRCSGGRPDGRQDLATLRRNPMTTR
ncbi:hypothetical protein, partial [Stieleria mannarensis]|uniref:hypothetical protein n=1 Tax=Stieleria mannarensis TaxID=2755585 RepID=UPI001C71AC6B